MTARIQDSPFRETAWDQRLDKMLDDLKTTVSPEGDRPSSRKENSLVSSFRSTSRSESRTPTRTGVEDGGLMKHHHKEYTSPDKTTRMVSDQYEYDSGDPNKFQKKVMKSTYSSYKVSGGLSSDLDSLRQGPPASVIESAVTSSDYGQHTDTKVITASQKVANKLVDALSTIGPDGKPIASGSTGTTTIIRKTDYSTLTKLNDDIRELDSMIEDMERQEKESQRKGIKSTTSAYKEKRTTVQTSQSSNRETGQDVEMFDNVIKTNQKPVHAISSVPAAADQAVRTTQKSDHTTTATTTSSVLPYKESSEYFNKAAGTTQYPNSYTSAKHTTYSTSHMNGTGKPGIDDEVEIINEPTGGEVRKIVWRNRFEKTYETHDSSTPSMTIEAAARRQQNKIPVPTLEPPVPQRGPTSPRQLQLQYAVYWPAGSPNVSPGGQSWADPIPLPTPPQVSPKGEPGVAYIYTYGQGGGTQIQHLPPLNYVTVNPPTSDGAPSPSPSSGNQPIIYHYSYHYTLHPGQSLPEGVPQPPGGLPGRPSGRLQPALEVAPPVKQMALAQTVTNSGTTSQTSYGYKNQHQSTSRTSTNRTEDTSDVHHHHHYYPSDRYKEETQVSTSGTRYDGPEYPKSRDIPRTPDESNRNMSVTINKTTTTTHHMKDYPYGQHGPSSTSTPYRHRDRSRSPSPPDRYPRGPTGSSHASYVTRTYQSDSLERLRKPQHESLPFPDTSPIKSPTDSKIPRRVDDLMTSFSDSEHLRLYRDDPNKRKPSPIPPSEFDEGDLHRGLKGTRGLNGPKVDGPGPETALILDDKRRAKDEMDLSESRVEMKKREESRNVAGPPVYYPPGHQQLFNESMHTMTLKENKRRGMAKWRMEKAAGYKESSAHSESKGGMAMVPVCLPLCCGAACAIM